MSLDMTNTTVRMPNSLLAQLKTAAKEKAKQTGSNTTVQAVVRAILTQHLATASK